MSVGRICSRIVVTATPGESVRAGARRMAEHGVGTLVILSADGANRAIGFVTDRDITLRCVAGNLDPDHTPLSGVMSHPVRSVHEDTPIEEAILEMSRGAIRRLVVTGAEDRPVGILSLDDVLDLLIGEFGPVRKLLERQAPELLTM
ncbi:MAG TPA: CBS domain-containing protein [Gemmatimonadales bacterium]